jgi:bifunctional non-homologous end joining protein LigD
VAKKAVSRVLFPRVHFTLSDLEKIYEQLGPYLLPHLRNRPVSVKRFTDDIHGPSFWEKEAPAFRPQWIKTVAVPRADQPGDIHYLAIENQRALRWAASVGSIEMHPFLHTYLNLNQPTAVAFDLDPGKGADILTVCTAALLLNGFLQNCGLQSWAKVSGSKGIQVYVPLNTPVTYGVTEAFARKAAEALAEQVPQLVTSEMAKSVRTAKVLIDWSQNSPYKSNVAVYSLRANAEIPYVSMPVTWQEVRQHARSRNPSGLFFTPEAALRRLEDIGDLFRPALEMEQELPPKLLREWQIGPAVGTRGVVQTSRGKGRSVALRSSGQGGRKLFGIKASGSHFELNLHWTDVVKQWTIPSVPGADENVIAREGGEKGIEYVSENREQWWDLGLYELIEGSYPRGNLRLYFSGRRLQGEWELALSSAYGHEYWVFTNSGGRIGDVRDEQPAARDVAEPAQVGGRPVNIIRALSTSRDTQCSPVQSQPCSEAAFVVPMECKEVHEPEQLPTNRSDWLYEIKWDGYRTIAVKRRTSARLYTRTGKTPTCRHSHIEEALHSSQLPDCTLDGELIAFDENRVPRFQLLQNSHRNNAPVVFVVFDIVNYDGRNVTGLPLHERKQLLRSLSEELPNGLVALSEEIEADIGNMLRVLRRKQMEGVVAKSRRSIYRAGKVSQDWVKYWIGQQTAFVIGGYLRGKDPLFEALIVGEYVKGKLIYREKVRHGLMQSDKIQALEMIQSLRISRCPFVNLPQKKRRGALDAAQMKDCTWVKPEVWCILRYKERTAAGEIREHGLFRGIQRRE